jgi:hypothetical protein
MLPTRPWMTLPHACTPPLAAAASGAPQPRVGRIGEGTLTFQADSLIGLPRLSVKVPSAATIYCFPSGASTILPALARQFTTFIRDMSAIASGATAARTDFTALSLVPRCDGSIAWCSGHEGLGWWMCKQAFLADFGARARWAPMHAPTHPPTHTPTHPHYPSSITHRTSVACLPPTHLHDSCFARCGWEPRG